MIRLPRWIVPALAVLLLIVIAGPANSSRHASAAPQAATRQPQPTRVPPTKLPQPTRTTAPTFALPTFTPVPGVEATAAATQGPLVFSQAPSPDTGTLGIILDRTQTAATIQTVVPGGPAEKGGIQAGDVVTGVDGTAVSDATALIAAITAQKAGNTITLTVSRGSASQDIKVTIATRREVYCPLPAPSVKAGAALITGNPRWTLESVGTPGVKLTLTGSKMSFKPTNSGQPWQGFASIKLTNPQPVTDYLFSVDITQTNQTIAGVLLNFQGAQGNTYLLQFAFNGSWTVDGYSSDGSTHSGPSFSESGWKVPDANNPSASATNTVGVTVQKNNFYLSLNGAFVCGLPFSQIVDPPYDPGALGAFAVVQGNPSGKLGVSYTKVTLNAVAP